MSHLQRVQPDSVWVTVYVPKGDDLRKIDANTVLAINGKDGGTYAPSSPIIIGGAGLVVAGPCVFASSSVILTTGGNSRVVFDADAAVSGFDLPIGHPARSRTRMRPVFEAYVSRSDGLILPGLFSTAGVVPTGARFFIPLDVDNGGQLDSVTFRYLLASSTPNPMIVRVVRVSPVGTIEPLRSADATSGTDEDGFQLTGPIFVSNALFTYICNQNNAVDIASYAYMLEVIDQGNSVLLGVGDQLFSTTVAVSALAVLDGRM